jgi:hypothetical protein
MRDMIDLLRLAAGGLAPAVRKASVAAEVELSQQVTKSQDLG